MTHPNTSCKAIALDLATVTGFAAISAGTILSGSQNFARLGATKKRLAQHPGEPYAAFRRWLTARVQSFTPASIIFEEVMFFKFALAAHMYCGLRGHMMAVAAEQGIPCFGYSPSEIKKFWTGKGNADKNVMMAETEKRFPALDLTDSNEADALAMLHLHLSTLR